jgi:hypothetical protein
MQDRCCINSNPNQQQTLKRQVSNFPSLDHSRATFITKAGR